MCLARTRTVVPHAKKTADDSGIILAAARLRMVVCVRDVLETMLFHPKKVAAAFRRLQEEDFYENAHCRSSGGDSFRHPEQFGNVGGMICQGA